MLRYIIPKKYNHPEHNNNKTTLKRKHIEK
jgi:hypothetical protein